MKTTTDTPLTDRLLTQVWQTHTQGYTQHVFGDIFCWNKYGEKNWKKRRKKMKTTTDTPFTQVWQTHTQGYTLYVFLLNKIWKKRVKNEKMKTEENMEKTEEKEKLQMNKIWKNWRRKMKTTTDTPLTDRFLTQVWQTHTLKNNSILHPVCFWRYICPE